MQNSGCRVAANWPAVPADNATIVMFATHDKVPTGGTATFAAMRGVLSVDMGGNTAVPLALKPALYADIDAIEITWLLHNKAAAANGVRLYARDNAGVWRESDHPGDNDVATIGATVTVGALTPPATKRIFIDVTRYIYGWAVEYTAGVDNPENWAGCIALHLRSGAVIR